MGGFTFDTNLASMHTYLGGTDVQWLGCISSIASWLVRHLAFVGKCALISDHCLVTLAYSISWTNDVSLQHSGYETQKFRFLFLGVWGLPSS